MSEKRTSLLTLEVVSHSDEDLVGDQGNLGFRRNVRVERTWTGCLEALPILELEIHRSEPIFGKQAKALSKPPRDSSPDVKSKIASQLIHCLDSRGGRWQRCVDDDEAQSASGVRLDTSVRIVFADVKRSAEQ